MANNSDGLGLQGRQGYNLRSERCVEYDSSLVGMVPRSPARDANDIRHFATCKPSKILCTNVVVKLSTDKGKPIAKNAFSVVRVLNAGIVLYASNAG